MRPLGIFAYEDILVQFGLNRVLNAIYEADFLDVSYSFRTNKSCHDALKLRSCKAAKPSREAHPKG